MNFKTANFSGEHQFVATRHTMRAFTRLDLVVATGLVVILFFWLGVGRVGERGRIVRCAGNLNLLNQAMRSYASDHQDCLPPASIEPQRLSWDAQLAPYFPRDQIKDDWGRLLLCPSATSRQSRPRSYAMPAYDMSPDNWPPGPGVNTGVGLVWNKETIQALLDEQMAQSVSTNTEELAMLKRSSIPSPVNTLLLTEFNSDSNVKETRMAAINGVDQQLEQSQNPKLRIHGGRYNYLMVDGHVELLSPLQSARIWTIGKSE